MVPAVSENTRFLHQLLALMIALAMFVTVWLASAILIQALDFMLGLDAGWLQSVLRHLIAPWLGGFLGVAAGLHWFKRASARFVFLSFGAAILLLVFTYLAAVEHPIKGTDFSLASYYWLVVPLGACIFGAYNAAHNYHAPH